MSEQIQKLFDTIAPKYDLLNSLLSFNIDQSWRNEAVRLLQGDRYKNVLDLCAGTLALTTALLKTNLTCKVTAADFSEPMLRAGEKNLSPDDKARVGVQVVDAMKMNFPDKSFDAVMCAYGMRNVDSNEVVLKKIQQSLRPGGKLVLLEFFKPEGLLSQIFNLTYAEMVIPLLGKFVSKHPNAYQYLRDSVRNFYTPTAYKELLKGLGFERIETKALTGGISHLVTAEVS